MLEWQLFVIFMRRRAKSLKGEFHGQFSLSFSLSVLFMSFGRVFFIIWDYYSAEMLYRIIAWILTGIGTVTFALIIPSVFFTQIKKKAFLRKFYTFSVIPALVSLLILYYLFTHVISIIIISIGSFFYLLPFIFHFVKWLNETGGIVKKCIQTMLCGVALVMIGYANPTKYLIGVNPWSFIILIAGMLLIAAGTWGLPNMAELDWRKKMRNLYVITKGGVCIFEKTFTSEDTMDSMLVSGGLTGVVTIVQEMTKSDKRLNSIQQEGHNILLAYGDYVTVALIAQEDLVILHDKIKRLRIEIESFYMDVLPGWSGDIEVFKPISVLVDKTMKS
ncbi:MAG: hypothetical protein ACFFCS_15025 [Candidatus Hodarchaeota archaeon]